MTQAPLTIGVVAGEASGDLLGSHLIQALRQHVPHARFTGIGGPRMTGAGFESIFPMEKLAVMGIVEVLRHYPEIAGIRRRLAAHFLSERPRLFIGIDAPEFNLGLELKLKSAGVPTAHYVGPSIWAWRAGRIHKIKRAVSKMLVLFPFEAVLYERAHVPVSYVGHPLADASPDADPTEAAREQLRLPAARKVIALLPGSRQSEVRYMAPTFVHTARQIAGRQAAVHFLVPLVSRETRAIFEEAVYAAGAGDLPLSILFGHAREAIAACDVALVASGTATLEIALARKPMVITYKVPELTYRLMSRMAYLPWIGLPNIIAGEFLVPEILQHDATPENLAQAVLNSLNDPAVNRRLPERLEQIRQLLRQDTATRATDALMPWLQAA